MGAIFLFHSVLDCIHGYLFFSAGRKVAVDASMCIYQFLIAVRQEGAMLTNEDGETTRYSSSDYIISWGERNTAVTQFCKFFRRSKKLFHVFIPRH